MNTQHTQQNSPWAYFEQSEHIRKEEDAVFGMRRDTNNLWNLTKSVIWNVAL